MSSSVRPIEHGVEASRGRAPVAPGLLLGIGLGGFVDGIVLHQLLQWHHMLTATERYPSTTIAGLEANTLADGLFHVSTWLFVFVGMWLANARDRCSLPAGHRWRSGDDERSTSDWLCRSSTICRRNLE